MGDFGELEAKNKISRHKTWKNFNLKIKKK